MTTPEYKRKPARKERPFSRQWFYNYALILVGSAIIAGGYVFFVVPFNIVPGGVVGLGMLVNHLTGFPIGLTALIINIPLLLWGMRAFSTSFSIKTVVAMILMSGMIDMLIHFWGHRAVTDDVLVSTIFGGVCIGLGLALVIRADATTGGTVIIARLVSRYLHLPVGKLLLVTDGLIVLSSIFVFRDINLAPYAIVAIFVISRTIDAVLTGLDNKKAVFIISEKHEEIRSIILDKMDRGGTYITASGLFYKDKERRMIFSALSPREMAVLQSYIRDIDPEAFITVVNANEIIGSGFKAWE
ncbi:MAG: YitT family protein [candidate division Zixibacteria bacterium]|nr:YitT family protein [candidate division Zixibacteria bacterium]